MKHPAGRIIHQTKRRKEKKAEVGENLIWSLLYDTAYKISHFKDKIH